MKAKKDLRKDQPVGLSKEQEVKAKKLAPEKKIKNEKRILYEEIEEDEDLDSLVGRKKDSIHDYYEDDEEFDDEEDDFYEDNDYADDDEEEEN